MAQELFGRKARVTIHELVIEGLRIAFEVEKSLKPEPNTCELRITNLNADHRKQLQEQKVIPVRLEAGYEPPAPSSGTLDALAGIGVDAKPTYPSIFAGDLRQAWSDRQGSDWVTTIRSGDGGKAKRGARVQMSFRPGVRWQQIMTDLVKKAGVEAGNALSEITGAAEFFTPTAGPVSVSGGALDHLDRISRSFGFETSVQDGALQMLRLGKGLDSSIVELNGDTGLVGSPEPANDGLVRFRSLMNPDIAPGRRVNVVARSMEGVFRVERATYSGDTAGGPWYVDVEGKPV
jgi:hypothetical protein